ncbi:MAG TPA: hypothetical protein VNT32_12965, partial [Thermoleophilaceae bacterium]|nr:hypothetical protein [Thermoleophilaceae bacterium]
SGLDPIEVFPAVSALLLGLVAAGFALVALVVLRAPPLAAPLAALVLMLDAAALHVAVHPYWNQLWGLASLPFALVLGRLAVAERHRGAAALFALMLVLGLFAYPLMIPYPVIAVGGFALMSGLRPRLPDWPRRRLAVAGGIALVLLAVPLYGVLEKIVSATRQFTDPSPDLSAWTGDIVEFLPAESFVSLRGGAFTFVLVVLVAALALWRAVPREMALPLAVLLGLSGLAMLRFRTIEFGAYFDYKHLAFVGPILLVLCVAAVAWVAGRGRAGLVAAAVAVAAWGAVATAETRDELAVTFDQVTPSMLELRDWSDRIPAGSSIRLDIPPTGVQLWAGYFMHEHPLTAFIPVVGTTYPHAPQGIRADYSLALTHLPETPDEPFPPTPDAIPEPVLRNGQFMLRRLRPAPPEIPATASKRMVPGIPASQPPAD